MDALRDWEPDVRVLLHIQAAFHRIVQDSRR